MNHEGVQTEVILALELFCDHVEKVAIRNQQPEPDKNLWKAVLDTAIKINEKHFPTTFRNDIVEKRNDLIVEIKNPKSTLESKCMKLQHVI